MLDQKEYQFLIKALPFWDKLNEEQKEAVRSSAAGRKHGEGESLHNGEDDCVGLLLVQSGQIRVYIISEAGKEITLFRLFERDICILSASCMLKNISFDVNVQAEKESRVIIIPTQVYDQLNKASLPVSDYTNQLISSRFSDVMWIMEQILFMSFDKRLAIFLLDQASIEGGDNLSITHETIAKHMGTAREVVTRMLRYFQNEGIVALSRGGLSIVSRDKLQRLT